MIKRTLGAVALIRGSWTAATILSGFATAALIIAGGSAAQAADLEVVSPPIAIEQPADWSGFYAGVHAGYGWGKRAGCAQVFAFHPITECKTEKEENCLVSCARFTSYENYTIPFDYSQQGFLLGAQGGYNKQIGHFLLGAEVLASWSNVTGVLPHDQAGGGVGTWKALGEATVKAGIANDKAMLYVKGGYGLGSFDFAGNLGCNFNMMHQGPVAGAGLGVKLSPKVSLDLSYSHMWFDTKTTPCSTLIFVAIPTQVRTGGSVDIVRLGLNYQFGE